MMNLPRLAAIADLHNKGERFRKAIQLLEGGLADKHIWNVDYEESKNTLSRIAEEGMEIAARPYKTHTREAGGEGHVHGWGANWGNTDKDARWMTIYTPSFMNVPGAIKKLEKYEGTEDATFGKFLGFLREVAQVVELIKSVKLFIEKGRKPSENPVEKDVTNTGICPVCMRRQKLNFDGTLVAHGYTIPRGWGGRNGMCIGRSYKAWELSPEGAIVFKKILVQQLAEEKERLEILQTDKLPVLMEQVRVRKAVEKYEMETRKYDRGTPDYDRVKRSSIFSIESNIRYLTKDIEEVTARITNWKQQPLMYGGAETQERWKSKMLRRSK